MAAAVSTLLLALPASQAGSSSGAAADGPPFTVATETEPGLPLLVTAEAGNLGAPLVRATGIAVTDSVRSRPTNCPDARKAVRFYQRRYVEWRAKMGAVSSDAARSLRLRAGVMSGCPRYLAAVWKRKARAARRAWESWRTLRDYPVRAGAQAWLRAVRETQKPYPGTRAWLLSCSASEGGWGRWVPNSQDSGSGGWLQFMESTFWRMWGAAKADVRSRGFRVPASAASWYSPLGQALAGAWGVTHGRSGEWYGRGC